MKLIKLASLHQVRPTDLIYAAFQMSDVFDCIGSYPLSDFFFQYFLFYSSKLV
jgi:hypothetical protein